MLLRTLGCGLAVLLLGGCDIRNMGANNIAPLDPEIQRALSQADAGQYDAMYDDGTSQLHSTYTKAAFVAYMQQLDAKMGQCQAAVETAPGRPQSTTDAEWGGAAFTRTCASGVWTVTIGVIGQDGVGRLNFYDAEPAARATNAAANAAASNALQP